jgi:cellulose synthase/poly-beta-1,6-N-acetylglucosamine synthase-like glycosyltransferase
MMSAKVSFIIVARNAETYLPDLFADFLAQDYPADQIELLLVGAPGLDNTMAEFERFSSTHPVRHIRVFANPKCTLPAGWNIALAASTGEVILRVDAHARFGPSFISSSVAALERGENIVGGFIATYLPSVPWSRFLSLADESRFGGSAADFRNLRRAGYVDTLGYAAYRRHVFHDVGGYDERLVRNEDNEMHYRMKKAGYRFYYSPTIGAQHFARKSLGALLLQKYLNGLWVALALSIHPCCFQLRHLTPAFFVGAILGSLAVASAGIIWPFAAGLTLYTLVALGYTVRELFRPESKGCRRFFLVLPAIFLLIHLSYGIGAIAGALMAPRFQRKNLRYILPRPI